MEQPYLKFISSALAWLPDVPARDLSKAEAEFYGVEKLLDSGLYEFVEVKAKPAKKPAKEEVNNA